MTVLCAHADLYGKQVFYCTNDDNDFTISLYICTVIWSVVAAVRIIIFVI